MLKYLRITGIIYFLLFINLFGQSKKSDIWDDENFSGLKFIFCEVGFLFFCINGLISAFETIKRFKIIFPDNKGIIRSLAFAFGKKTEDPSTFESVISSV